MLTDLGTLGGNSSYAQAINSAGEVVGYSDTATGGTDAFLWTSSGGMEDLGTLGGNESVAQAVNTSGQVVGWSITSTGATHAFSWTASGGMVDLGTLGGTISQANAVNDSGEVVGQSYTPNGTTAFSWTASGGMVDLGNLGNDHSEALAVSDSGQVVGDSDTAAGGTDAFSWTPAGGMVDLGTLGGETSSPGIGRLPRVGTPVNDSGEVVGDSTTAAGANHAFLWTAADGMVDLGTLEGGSTGASSINASGQVVGDSGSDAFLWTAAGGMTDLGTLGGGSSEAFAINDSGEVVGDSATTEGAENAFAWTESGGMVNLGSLGGFSTAVDINDAGEIAGYGATPSGSTNAFVWESQSGSPVQNTAPPTVTGIAQDGQALVATHGTWTAPTKITNYGYQWQRCTVSSCAPIPGATRATYRTTSKDVGDPLEVTVTATDARGETGEATSAQTAAVADPPSPDNTAPPRIIGTVQDGQTVRASKGKWVSPDKLVYTYQWDLCASSAALNCQAISSAASDKLTSADVGSYLEVVVTATDEEAQGATQSSSLTQVSPPPAPTNVTAPAIKGAFKVGGVLRTSNGAWHSPDPLTYTYQWFDCPSGGSPCTKIAGAQAQTYTLSATDVAGTVEVEVGAVDQEGGSGYATSASYG